ncbi:MAG: hypothetical protein KIT27_09595 [Legionellales bacterium]|nr:hypothetical protein [Legionellales bacterium]
MSKVHYTRSLTAANYREFHSTPILVLPNFDLSSMSFHTLKRATITITEGYRYGDQLELDSNFTLVAVNDKLYIQNTNIYLVNHGFNKNTHQLILEGEDSAETYSAIFESILLDNPLHPKGEYYKICFSVTDTDNENHRLGSTIIDHHDLAKEPILDSIFGEHQIINEIYSLFSLDEFYSTAQNCCIYEFSFGQGNDNYYGDPEQEINVIHLTGIKQGPTNAYEKNDSWSLHLTNLAEYKIIDNILLFNFSANGTLTLADGSDLYFENIDMIRWG